MNKHFRLPYRIGVFALLLVIVSLVIAACAAPAAQPSNPPAQATSAPAQATSAPAQPTAAQAQATSAPSADVCPLNPKANLVWVSPRGTLEVMDDYPLWVAKKLGYFDQVGVNVDLQPGPLGGANVVSLLPEGKADVSFPSPGVLAASIDAGIPVIMPWEMFGGQVFDFAVPADSTISSVKDLAGKTIALGSSGWTPIVDPILAEQGVDPKSVKYVEAGQQWGQTVDQKKADAALAWEGLRAQWQGIGLKLKYLIGNEFSKDPSNGYVVRAADLQDPAKKATLTCFLRAVAMGMEFARVNPQAAAQITYEQFPALKDQMNPALALESMRQLEYGYNQSNKAGKGYGYSDVANWQSYLDRVFKLGQTKKQINASEAVTNELVGAANAFDHDKVAADAKAYQLNDTWKNVQLQGPVE
ncbi:MAG TPA: ABC transporter substrate-binding protein [Anaerolineae bacterium]|nr:ABC transporter substrate-binding protein [Anaerolineae bacterium]